MLDELEGKGWNLVEMPLERDEPSVICRYNGAPIRAGFTMEESAEDDQLYFKFRSGRYNIELKVGPSGRGQVRVTKADGYVKND